jgi:hypothetical protein
MTYTDRDIATLDTIVTEREMREAFVTAHPEYADASFETIVVTEAPALEEAQMLADLQADFRASGIVDFFNQALAAQARAAVGTSNVLAAKVEA